MLGKRFQQQGNMKFAQLHYFLSQNVGGVKRYYVPPCPKSWRGHVPPINSVSAMYDVTIVSAISRMLRAVATVTIILNVRW